MNIKEFAEMLNGKEYHGTFLSDEERKIAVENGFVVCTGASDDLMEIEGAIEDEASCFDGGDIYIDECGVVPAPIGNEKCITAIWGKDGCSWQYETDIPHETFNVMENENVYCKGIVFELGELNV